jgi:HPt (histidine-containing phosphotransfer) domain-containing protein
MMQETGSAAADTAAAAHELPVIDASAVAVLRSIGGNDALFRRVLNLFLKNVPESLRKIRALQYGGDDLDLADAAHALKSICISVGAKRAQHACHELELLLRTGQPFDMMEKIEAIAREAEAAVREAVKLRAA